MEKEQLTERMMEAEETMFHLAFSILHQEQDCSDAVQEAVVRAWSARDTLKNPSYFKTWIIRILLNECYTLLRKQKKQASMGQALCASVLYGGLFCEADIPDSADP